MIRRSKSHLGLVGLLLVLSACGGKRAASRAPRPSRPAPPATGRVPEARPAPTPPAPGPAPALRSPGEPLVRVALLTSVFSINLASEGALRVRDRTPEAEPFLVLPPVTLRLEEQGGRAAEPAGWTVQVASLSAKDRAEALRKELERRYGEPGDVRFNQAGRTFQVRLGRFATREQAERFAGKLLRGGQPGWVVEASVSTAASSGKVGLHARRNELFKVSSQGFYVTPESGDRLLELEGKKYRGAVEVFANRQGRLTVVNVLGMEEYLRGVVPNELSPYTYPELEALKAQAVAARTYALRHRDGFARDGYDLMATDRSQVYGGADAERPLSSRAVEETRGIAATYAGEPIQAFYSSTCGGMTENFENIFGGAPIPYLRGVTCAPEQGAEGLRWSTNGTWSSLRVFAAEDRKSLAREVALALTLGLDHASSWSAEDWASPVRREELRSWVESVGVLRDAPAIPDGPDALEVHSWVNWLVRRAYGNVLLNAADVDYLLYSIRDEAEIPEPSRPSVAHLVQKHLVLPFPDSTVRPRLRLSRGLALRLLIAILADARLLPLERGTVVESSEGGSLRIRSGGQEAEVKASPRAFLVKQAGSDYLPVESLHFVGGELVAYRTNGREVLYLEAAPNPKGASSDRFSPFSHWEVRYSRQELLKKLRGKLPLRDVVDLQPARYGVSGRVIELKVVHSGAPLVLRPGEIRNYLGLRDTLFSIQRETNAAGQIEAFLFTGRGWGHGVGLCQVGAFGMARAGQSYQRILKTYYRGVEVERLY